jgi:hypothetical protein
MEPEPAKRFDVGKRFLKLLPLLFAAFLGFYFGVMYENGTVEKTEGLYTNSCKSGQVALFEGGVFAGCQQPTRKNQENNESATTSTNTNKKTYENQCQNGQIALYEGGVLTGCSVPSE